MKGTKGGAMGFSSRQHILFSLAYSLTVFAGLNLTGYVHRLRFLKELFWMAGGSGLCLYRPIIGAFYWPPFWAMAVPTLLGLFVVSYFVSVVLDKITSQRFRAESKTGYLLTKTGTCFWVNWLMLWTGASLLPFPKP
jgi:hypothetical protein